MAEIERWDAVSPSGLEEARSLGYSATDIGKLFLQRDGQFVAELGGIEDAATVIARETNIPVSVIHRRWVGHEDRFVFNLTSQ